MPPAPSMKIFTALGFDGRLRMPLQCFAALTRVLPTPMKRDGPLPRLFMLGLKPLEAL